MIYVFDLDGTICKTDGNDYPRAVPVPGMVEAIRRLYTEGHRIIVYTARGMGSGKDWEGFTQWQLNQIGLPFAELHMGKLSYDVWVDDKAVNAADWLKEQDE